MAARLCTDDDKDDLKIWRDGGLVLACDQISSMVTFMKMRRDRFFGRDLVSDLVSSLCFTVALYIPVRVFTSIDINMVSIIA